MTHSLMLSGLVVVLAAAATAVAWTSAPVWYHAISLALVLPFVWLGGSLRMRGRRGG